MSTKLSTLRRRTFAAGLLLSALSFTLPGSVSAAAANAAEAPGQQIQPLTRQLIQLVKQRNQAGNSSNAGSDAQLQQLLEERRQLMQQLIADKNPKAVQFALPPGLTEKLPVALQALLEIRDYQTGELQVLVEDRLDHSHVYHYLLETEAGETLEVQFPGKAKGLLSGNKVRLYGVSLMHTDEETDSAADGQMLVSEGEGSMQLLANNGGTVDGSALSGVLSNTTGEQTVLVLTVNFQDTADQKPYTPEAILSRVLGEINDFYVEASDGQTWFTGDSLGWLTLPIASTCNLTDILVEADAKALAAGFDAETYDRVIYFLESSAGCFWAGIATVQGSRAWINGAQENWVIAHEMGHSLGLQHSNAMECGATVLGDSCSSPQADLYDVMGGGQRFSHFNAYQKERLGWFRPGEIETVTASGNYALAPYAAAGGIYPKALKVLKETSAAGKIWYYLEKRTAEGFDNFIATEAGNVANGVLFHTGADFDGNTSLSLDMNPDSSFSSWYDRTDVALEPGESFADPAAGASFTTLSADASGAEVAIAMGGASAQCVTSQPQLAISPAAGPWVTPGTVVEYSVSVTSQDSSACAARDFSLTGSYDAGLTGLPGNSIVSLAPGESTPVSLLVSSSASLADGVYSFSISTEGASVTASYAVAGIVTSNEAPLAQDDSATTTAGNAVRINVLQNDQDPDGDQLSITAVDQPSDGVVVINSDNSLTYTASANARNSDSFAYYVTDGINGAVSAQVSIRISKSSTGTKGNGKGPNK